MSKLNDLDSELHRIINLPVKVTESNFKGWYFAEIDIHPNKSPLLEGGNSIDDAIKRAKDHAYAHYGVKRHD